MSGKSVTRADLSNAVYQRVGLSRAESARLVESALEGICETLEQGYPLFEVQSDVRSSATASPVLSVLGS